MDGPQWDELQLQIGRYDPLCQSVTTDHPCQDWMVGRAGLPPSPPPPGGRDGGGGDLPGRWQLLLAQGSMLMSALLLALGIVGWLSELRELARRS